MEVKDITTIIVAIISSGAVFGFLQFIIQFLVTRADMKQSIGTRIDNLSERIDRNQEAFDEYRAVQARVHILRFADELRNGADHSLDYYRQTLLDASLYEHYTATHPNFSNGITELSIELIEKRYKQEIERGENHAQF